MVELETARTREHTRGVELELRVDGHRDGDGLLGNASFQGRDATCLDVSVRLGSSVCVNSAGGLARPTVAVARGVRVVLLCADPTIGLDPSEGLVHPPAVATSINSITTHQ